MRIHGENSWDSTRWCVCKDAQCAAHTHIFSNDMLNKLCLFDQSINSQHTRWVCQKSLEKLEILYVSFSLKINIWTWTYFLHSINSFSFTVIFRCDFIDHYMYTIVSLLFPTLWFDFGKLKTTSWIINKLNRMLFKQSG